jgi:predicted Rossmann fold flavoprotein
LNRDDAPVVIVGAGASGLMAAIHASGRGRTTLLVEGTRDGGRKILISGGGRCNILPSVPAPERFVTDSSPNTLRNILRGWPLSDQRRFFEEALGLPLVLEPETGKLFPRGNSARQVRDALVALARARGAELRFGLRVREIEPSGVAWRVVMEGGEPLLASAVVISTGGRSVPATGSDGWGLEVLSGLGHVVHPSYPALAPLTANPAPHAHLAGVSMEVTLETPLGKKKLVVRGGFLFTHRGYSGPAVLDISHAATRSGMRGGPRQDILVKWSDFDDATWERALLQQRGEVAAVLAKHLPARLAEALCQEAGLERQVTCARLKREKRLSLVNLLTRYPLPWTGDEGYAKAEVTGGGVDLGEVEPRTLESRRHKGLFLCGEVLDAFGPIGGHNFQWAWATGRAAGLGASGER